MYKKHTLLRELLFSDIFGALPERSIEFLSLESLLPSVTSIDDEEIFRRTDCRYCICALSGSEDPLNTGGVAGLLSILP